MFADSRFAKSGKLSLFGCFIRKVRYKLNSFSRDHIDSFSAVLQFDGSFT